MGTEGKQTPELMALRASTKSSSTLGEGLPRRTRVQAMGFGSCIRWLMEGKGLAEPHHSWQGGGEEKNLSPQALSGFLSLPSTPVKTPECPSLAPLLLPAWAWQELCGGPSSA